MEVIVVDSTPASEQADTRDPSAKTRAPGPELRASAVTRSWVRKPGPAPKLVSRASGCVMRDPGFERLL
ncbi:hypothetical protein GCM10010221_10650 [Streptomyces parvus]|nr:hypothetical protein GCM10010221_10650 [Streptomyces parvus]